MFSISITSNIFLQAISSSLYLSLACSSSDSGRFALFPFVLSLHQFFSNILISDFFFFQISFSPSLMNSIFTSSSCFPSVPLFSFFSSTILFSVHYSLFFISSGILFLISICAFFHPHYFILDIFGSAF